MIGVIGVIGVREEVEVDVRCNWKKRKGGCIIMYRGRGRGPARSRDGGINREHGGINGIEVEVEE